MGHGSAWTHAQLQRAEDAARCVDIVAETVASRLRTSSTVQQSHGMGADPVLGSAHGVPTRGGCVGQDFFSSIQQNEHRVREAAVVPQQFGPPSHATRDAGSEDEPDRAPQIRFMGEVRREHERKRSRSRSPSVDRDRYHRRHSQSRRGLRRWVTAK